MITSLQKRNYSGSLNVYEWNFVARTYDRRKQVHCWRHIIFYGGGRMYNKLGRNRANRPIGEKRLVRIFVQSNRKTRRIVAKLKEFLWQRNPTSQAVYSQWHRDPYPRDNWRNSLVLRLLAEMKAEVFASRRRAERSMPSPLIEDHALREFERIPESEGISDAAARSIDPSGQFDDKRSIAGGYEKIWEWYCRGQPRVRQRMSDLHGIAG